jgi:type VI secretion system secreted protein VgrG
VTDWIIEREIQPGLWAMADYNFKTPGAPIVVNANISRSHEHAGFEIYDYPGEYTSRQEGEAYAKLRIQEVQSQHEIIRGQATVRGLATGYTFMLKGHFRTDQNRAYLVTGTSLQASGGDYESGATDKGEFFTCGFTAIPAADPFRSARSTPKPLIQGPQTAMVVGRAGEEIDPDEFGRIKVQFHWDRQGKRDQDSSCWIRVSQAWAGKNWGAIYTPRVGQEVVVEFLEGDPDRPIITGVVYNAAATVPNPLPEHKTISTLKSSSTTGGQGFNEFRFDDKRGEEQIFIHAERNHDVRVKSDQFESIGHDQHLIVEHDKFDHVKNDRDEIVDRDHKESIGRDLHQKIGGKEAKEVGESLSLKVKGHVIEVFDKNHSEQVTKDYFLKADNVVIEAGTNLTLKVGSTFIAIESGGITISAPEIELKAKSTLSATANSSVAIESSGPASIKGKETTVEGSAMVTIKGAMVKIN